MLQKLKYFQSMDLEKCSFLRTHSETRKVETIINAGQVDIVLWHPQTLAIFHAV